VKRLCGKVAVVTGGAGLLGRATCQRLAAEGAAVVVADRQMNAAKALADAMLESGGQAVAVEADVADAAGAQRLMKATHDQLGRLDVLVNIAGLQSKARHDEISLEHWNAVIQGNLTATFLCIQAAIPLMVNNGGGRVINMSSFAVNGVPWFRQAGQGRSAYAAAKAGILGLTRTLSGELAELNINVNAVVPGPVREPEDRASIDALERNPLIKTPPLALIPKGRYATPDDVANAILFFASDESEFITGESLAITGGL
jgi:NAD(P)-dependent dehydrogenase (short-subunit alcohol dehydrogenase family)